LTRVIVDFNTVRQPARVTSAKWFDVALKPFQVSSSSKKEGLRRFEDEQTLISSHLRPESQGISKDRAESQNIGKGYSTSSQFDAPLTPRHVSDICNEAYFYSLQNPCRTWMYRSCACTTLCSGEIGERRSWRDEGEVSDESTQQPSNPRRSETTTPSTEEDCGRPSRYATA